MKINTIFFDLDGTLYPNNNGMWFAISEKMNTFMKNNINIPEDQIPILREKYFQDYGTTLRGLQENFNIDTEAYLEIVHDIPLKQYLQIDNQLNNMLKLMPQKKWIFTNSDHQHASRVLEALGIGQNFEGIIDVFATDFRPKPTKYAFKKALEISGSKSVESCLFVDDIPKNLIAAREYGIKTVLVGENLPNDIFDFHIKNIHDLLDEIPALINE